MSLRGAHVPSCHESMQRAWPIGGPCSLKRWGRCGHLWGSKNQKAQPHLPIVHVLFVLDNRNSHPRSFFNIDTSTTWSKERAVYNRQQAAGSRKQAAGSHSFEAGFETFQFSLFNIHQPSIDTRLLQSVILGWERGMHCIMYHPCTAAAWQQALSARSTTTAATPSLLCS